MPKIMDFKFIHTAEVKQGLTKYLGEQLDTVAFKVQQAAQRLSSKDENPRQLISQVRDCMDEAERITDALAELDRL